MGEAMSDPIEVASLYFDNGKYDKAYNTLSMFVMELESKLRWQPIETAPKTAPEKGKVMVLLVITSIGQVYEAFYQNGSWYEYWEERQIRPTYWMPRLENPND